MSRIDEIRKRLEAVTEIRGKMATEIDDNVLEFIRVAVFEKPQNQPWTRFVEGTDYDQAIAQLRKALDTLTEVERIIHGHGFHRSLVRQTLKEIKEAMNWDGEEQDYQYEGPLRNQVDDM